MFSERDQALLWTRGSVSKENLETDAQTTWPIDDYFEERIPGPWTRSVIILDVTGERSCTLYFVQDDDHLPTVDYVPAIRDPILNHVNEHQDELVEIARRVYGADIDTTH